MPVNFIYFSVQVCLDDLSISQTPVLKSPTINICSLICDLNFSNVCFSSMGALLFGYSCLELRYHIVRIFVWVVWHVDPCLLWIIMDESLLYQVLEWLLHPSSSVHLFRILFPAVYSGLISIFILEVCCLYASQ